jgi:hypothetical protein
VSIGEWWSAWTVKEVAHDPKLRIVVQIRDIEVFERASETLDRIAMAAFHEGADPELVVDLVKAEIRAYVENLWTQHEILGP